MSPSSEKRKSLKSLEYEVIEEGPPAEEQTGIMWPSALPKEEEQ
jgi:hypothetical protein